MLIVMELGATTEMVDNVCREIEKAGLKAHPMPGAIRTAIGITGNKAQVDADHLEAQVGVKEIIHVTKPFKLVSREFYPENSVIDVNGILIGGKNLVTMVGPCAVETRDQCMIIAEKVAASGAQIFRGGAYKPRTSPYSFQGLEEAGLKILAEVREKFGMAIITEAIDTEVLALVSEYADIVQIGARNMQNFSLLKKAGRQPKPVMLKRGMSATLEEFLMAAEYIMSEGNRNVILCERGVRTFA
ncbi:MAG: 3-deoxy-7-phosphoheptulonate synthase, partial [candidate division Zixibacteria bacterium]|nr:3-deoxy-7-phosphoheptulonate synthase [candidate division Zixibacteria bacterium]